MHFPNLRDVIANYNQSLVNLLESHQRVVNSLDNVLHSISGLPCDKKVFENFIKLRDLEKGFISSMKIKLNIDKEFLEILDKFLYFASEL